METFCSTPGSSCREYSTCIFVFISAKCRFNHEPHESKGFRFLALFLSNCLSWKLHTFFVKLLGRIALIHVSNSIFKNNQNAKGLCHLITASSRAFIYSVGLWRCTTAPMWWKPATGTLIILLLSYFLLPWWDQLNKWLQCLISERRVSCMLLCRATFDVFPVKCRGSKTARLPAGVSTASNMEPAQSWPQKASC